jgi:hypothetical protein
MQLQFNLKTILAMALGVAPNAVALLLHHLSPSTLSVVVSIATFVGSLAGIVVNQAMQVRPSTLGQLGQQLGSGGRS